MLAFAVLFFAFARPLGKGGEGFGRDTTAALRGLAMLGIMLHHIHNALGYSSTVLILAGYLTTGLFFFISGYGNTLSVNKRPKVSLDWLYKKILKIYIPFFAAYWIYYLFLILMHPELCPGIKETMVDLVTVSLPNEISWFPKIILLCFAVHWIAKKLFRNDTLQNGFITAVILVYMFCVILSAAFLQGRVFFQSCFRRSKAENTYPSFCASFFLLYPLSFR